MITRVGFTGTQRGMTDAQFNRIAYWFSQRPSVTLHHGDCIGADADAHRAAWEEGLRIEIHPPDIDRKRAFCQGAAVVHPPAPYLIRNIAIVDACEVLIATPKEETGEELRSGTWATVRAARKAKRRIVIVRPSGRVEVEPSKG
jgi:hypothetical protein